MVIVSQYIMTAGIYVNTPAVLGVWGVGGVWGLGCAAIKL